MLITAVSRLVELCTRFPWVVITFVLATAIVSGAYSASHFAINTDVNKLISRDLPWRQHEAAFERQFPGHFQSTLAVVDAPTPELASAAAGGVTPRVQGRSQLFKSVDDLNANPFFARNGLLFRPDEEVKQFTQGLAQAAPIIDVLATDQSLRGLAAALNLGLAGVQQGKLTLDGMQRALRMPADTIEQALAGKPAVFSWQEFLTGEKPPATQLRHFVEAEPVLDFSALEPGRASTQAIRQAA